MNVPLDQFSIAAATNQSPSFSPPDGGWQYASSNPYSDLGMSVALQADGKIVVGGYSNGALSAIRVNVNGHLDETFGTGGMVILKDLPEPYGQGYAIAIASDGSILLGGNAGSGDTLELNVVRLTSDGQLDTSFGEEGQTTIGVAGKSETGRDLVLQADGKVLISGYTYIGYNNTPVALARLNADGSPDTTFGAAGLLQLTGVDGTYNAVTLDVDGNILVAAMLNSSTVVIRLMPDGNADTAFGINGKATIDVLPFKEEPHDILVQPDGKIVIVADASDLGVARLNPDGSPDDTFGTGGRVNLDMGATNEHVQAVAIQSDGKLVIVGHSYVNSNFDTFAVRLNEDGSLDEDFGNGGKVVLDRGADLARDVAIQPDGKIVIAGYGGPISGQNDYMVIRLNQDGSLDSSFNTGPTGPSTLDGIASYTEGDDPVVLDGSVGVYDPELAAQGHYGGASVTLARQGGADAEDAFGATGKLVFTDTDAVFDGITIGTVVRDTGSLTIVFNEQATQVRVDKALSSITYHNASSTPPASVIIEWIFNDGNDGNEQGSGGALQAIGATTVNITETNDVPKIVGFDTSHTVALGSNWYTLTDVGTPISVIDGDTPLITNGTLQISLSGAPSNDSFMLGGPGTAVSYMAAGPYNYTIVIDDVTVGYTTGFPSGYLGGTLNVSLTNATLEDVALLLQSVRFAPGSLAQAGDRTLSVRLNDGQEYSEYVNTTITVVSPPKVDISLDPGSTSFNSAGFYVYFNWSVAPPDGFEFGIDDLIVNGGTFAPMQQHDFSSAMYRAFFTPTPGVQNALVSVSVNAGLFQDDNNVDSAPATFTVSGDTLAPTIASIVRDGGDAPTNANTVSFVVTFSEALKSPPAAADFTLVGDAGNGMISLVAATGTPNSYTVTVSGLENANGSLGLALSSTAELSDVAGNQVSGTTPTGANETFTLDTTGPEAPAVLLPAGGVTNEAAVDVGLDALEEGASWQYSVDGGLIWQDGENGSFTLQDGDYAAGQIRVRQIDAAGNPGEAAQNTAPVTVDTQQPNAPAVSSAALSNSTTPILSGTAEADSIVIVSLGGAAYTVQASETGAWSVNLATVAPDDGTGPLNLNANGANGITVTATDAAGNISLAGSQSLVIDTSAPAAPAGVSLPAGGATNEPEITVAPDSLEAGASWQYSVDGGQTWLDGDNGSFTLEDGDYAAGQIQVRQIDAAGNAGVATQNTAPVTVDTQQPDAPAISSQALSNSATPVLSGIAEADSMVTVSLGGAAYTVQASETGAWSVDLATEAPDDGTGPLALNANGANAITVIATDAAGNISMAGTQTLVIDTIAPAAPAGIDLPQGGATNEPGITVDLDSLEDGATWQYSVDGGLNWLDGDNGSFTLQDGDYAAGQIQVRQIDAAGNAGMAAQNTAPVTVDTQQPEAPAISSQALSNSATPVLSGTAEANSSVTVSVGGAAYTVQATETGAWSVALATTAPDNGTGPLNLDANGANIVTVTATDAAGNISTTGMQTLVIDTTAPTAPAGVMLPVGGPTNEAVVTVDLDGLEDDANWQYSVDGGQTWHDGSDGSFTLEDGQYAAGQIQVRQIDAAGNPGTAAQTLAPVTVDTLKPGIPTFTSDALSNSSTPVLSGTAEPDSTVVVSLGGAAYTVQAGHNGDWSVNLATATPDIGTGPLNLDANGANDVTVTATDAAGNVSTAGAQALVIDTNAPDAPAGVTLPVGGAINEPVVTVDPDGLEDGASWQYSVDGGQTWHDGSDGSFTLEDGEYAAGQIQVQQIDAAGNPGTAAHTTAPVTVDTQVPDAPAFNNQTLSNSIAPVLSGTAEPGSTVTVSLAGATYTVQTGQYGDWSVDLATAMPDDGTGPLGLDTNGANTVTVTATDAAGNVSTTGTQTLVIDTSAPAAPTGVTLPAGGDTNEPTITVNLDGLEDGASWQYSLDGGLTWLDGTDGSFTLEDGDYAAGQIQVRQIDAAGNPGTPAQTAAPVTIDTQQPGMPGFSSQALSNNVTPILSGNAEPNSVVTVSVAGATYTVQATGGGAWSVDLAVAVPDDGTGPLSLNANGANTVTVTATDAAGNTSSAATQDLVIDTTAPVAPAGVTLPLDGATNDAIVAVDLGHLENGASWQYSVDGGQNWLDGQGNTFILNDGYYAAGQIQVRQIDAAGNLGTSVQTSAPAIIDTQSPGNPVVASPALSNSATPKLSGTAEANGTVTVSVGGASYTVQAGENGYWSIDLAKARPDAGTGPLALNLNGANPVAVTTTDAAGNVSTATTQTLVIDTTEPSTPDVAFNLGGAGWIVTVSGLEVGATWEYQLAPNGDWTTGSGNSFEVPLESYDAEHIQVRQIDAAGNIGAQVGNDTPLTPPVTDHDNDGIHDSVENGVPGMANGQQGDGNGDGIADVEQQDVSSLPWLQTPDGQIRYVTLANDSGLTQTAVKTATIEADDLPEALELPLGALSFVVDNVPASGIVNFSVFVDGDIPVNGYFKQVDGTWFNIATGVTEVDGKWRIDFTIEDGGMFDADGERNGTIVDPGAPGWFNGNPADVDNDQAPDLLEFDLGLTVGARDNDVFARSDLFVLQLYRDALGREADSDGLAYWQQQLDSGALGRTDLALALLDSAEAASTDSLVRLSLALQERAPDTGEIAAWRADLADGASASTLSDAFVVEHYGDVSDADFVDLLYQDALGRAADTDGREYWLGQLAGQQSRGDVALHLLHSGEFEQANLAEIQIAELYAGLLGRPADAEGLAHWAASLEAGIPLDGIAASIIGSEEYHDRFLPGDDAAV